MYAEGRGHVAPAPISVHLDAADMDEIGRLGRQRALKYRNGTGWRGGLIGKTEDGMVKGEAPIRIGLIGEFAACRWIDRQMRKAVCIMDNAYREFGGDGGVDLRVAGITIDVKATSLPTYDSMLLRTVDDRKQLVPWVCDVFVFVGHADPMGKNDPELWGWIDRKDAQAQEFCKARKGDHFNVEVPRNRLLPMNRLISRVTARRLVCR